MHESSDCSSVWALRSGPDSIAPGAEAYRSYVGRSPANGFVRSIRPIANDADGPVHHLFVTRGVATVDDPMRPVLFAAGRQTEALELPSGVGLPLAKGEELELGLHLVNPRMTTASFDDGVELCLVERAVSEADVVAFGPEDFVIPADGAEHTFSAGCPVTGDRNVVAAWPHMHSLGRSIQIQNGTEILVDVADWDASEQPFYAFAPPRTARSGDALGVTCTFLNPTTAPVTSGHFAAQEMCLAFVYYYPAGLARGWGCGTG